jgi:hypothetical protein
MGFVTGWLEDGQPMLSLFGGGECMVKAEKNGPFFHVRFCDEPKSFYWDCLA